MVNDARVLYCNRAQIPRFVIPARTVERSIPHFRGGWYPYSTPPAVLSPGGLANTGLWRLKSVTYYTPCFCLFTQGKRLRDVPCCLIYLEFNLFEVKFSEAHSYLGFAMVK